MVIDLLGSNRRSRNSSRTQVCRTQRCDVPFSMCRGPRSADVANAVLGYCWMGEKTPFCTLILDGSHRIETWDSYQSQIRNRLKMIIRMPILEPWLGFSELQVHYSRSRLWGMTFRLKRGSSVFKSESRSLFYVYFWRSWTEFHK